jgi:hypothetical protein
MYQKTLLISRLIARLGHINFSCQKKEGIMNSLNHLKKLWGRGIIIKLAIALAIVFTAVIISYGQKNNTVRAEPVAEPIGNHDGSEGVAGYFGCDARGWTVDPDDYERDLPVQILSDGIPVITTTANLLREDIPPEICPGGTCGFNVNLWGLISLGEEHQITAQVYDQETDSWIDLDGTPKTLTCSDDIFGYHDGEEGVVSYPDCDARGWAVDPDDYERELTVQVLSDGSPVVTTTVDLLRSDIPPEICPGGTCGFSTSLWGSISAGVEHEVTAQAYDQETDSWINLEGTPKSLTCWGYPVGSYDGPEGIVGSAACSADGWAADPDDYERDLTVQILSDGSPVITTTANLLREGVDPEICPDGTCGFSADLWGVISPGVEHMVMAQVYDEETESWIDFGSEPKSLTCWGYPQGSYDGSEGVVEISTCNALGWTVDPDDYERHLTVQILSDGVPVTTTTADLLREDINPEICPGGTCGFFVDLWKLISPRTEHQIAPQVYDEETEGWIDLGLEPKSLTCWGYEHYLPSVFLRP